MICFSSAEANDAAVGSESFDGGRYLDMTNVIPDSSDTRGCSLTPLRPCKRVFCRLSRPVFLREIGPFRDDDNPVDDPAAGNDEEDEEVDDVGLKGSSTGTIQEPFHTRSHS